MASNSRQDDPAAPLPVLDYMETARWRRARRAQFWLWRCGGLVALLAISLILLTATLSLSLILYGHEITEETFWGGVALLCVIMMAAMGTTIIAIALWRLWPKPPPLPPGDGRLSGAPSGRPEVQKTHEPRPTSERHD